MHLCDTPPYEIKAAEICTIAKIASIGFFRRSNEKKKKDCGPFTKSAIIFDPLVHIGGVTIFANRLSKLTLKFISNFSQNIEINKNGDVVFKELLNIPLLKRIKIGVFVSRSNSNKVSSPKTNRVVDYIDICPDAFYIQWLRRMEKDLEGFI